MKSKKVPGNPSSRLTLRQKLEESPFFRIETLLIVGALVVGIGSAALSEANKDALHERLASQYQMVPVLVASKSLSPGAVVDERVVRSVSVLKGSVTDNMVLPDDLEHVVGRRLGIELKEGDPILLTAVEGAGLTDTVASKIPAGKRLVTLVIKDRVAGRGWVKPNDHVDVIANVTLPQRGSTTFTLLEDITLISVGNATVWENGKSSAGSEIGFFVSPEEVEFVQFAQKHGTFSLSLRNPRDVKVGQKNKAGMGAAGVDMTKFLDHATMRHASGGGDLPVYIKGKKVKRK